MPQKRLCMYHGCQNFTSDKEKNIRLYSFPADPERRAHWVNCSGNADRLTNIGATYRHTYLCEKHFDEQWFFDARRNKLITGAVPRQYVPPSSNSLSPITKHILVKTPVEGQFVVSVTVPRHELGVVRPSGVESPPEGKHVKQTHHREQENPPPSPHLALTMRSPGASVEALLDANVEAVPEAKVDEALSVEAVPEAKVDEALSVEAVPEAKVEAFPEANVEALSVGAVPEANVEAVPGVHALPDEILTFVFSMLTNDTKLDVLPLVCKRWRHLARDPSSWAGVELSVRKGSFHEYRAYRVLRYAPAVKSLEIGEWDVVDGFCQLPICAMLQSALRSGSVQVNTASIRIEGHGTSARADAEAAVVHFLSRQRSLRGLRLNLSWPYGAATLATVATLGSLRKLELIYRKAVPSGDVARYNGELARALPELRELRVYAHDRDSLGCFPGLVGDLARGARALRVLEVDLPSAADRDAVLQLRGLQHVHLHVFKDAVRPQATAYVVREAFAFLFQMDTTALQSLAIWLGRGEPDSNWLGELKLCHKVAEEFLSSMPHVSFDAFHGRNTKSNEWYREIISRLEKKCPKDAIVPPM
ncbi:uncharacterized protein LOC117651666 [Thrips palmi]|uniref:Uncharacterized protein LOC117651666 n=1 Tax=Thrips palmi TaxID=161013 RepID=A0A6P9A311_THRPL|nr:uncharacterized protein LOC117651666 [Thrips palmi]